MNYLINQTEKKRSPFKYFSIPTGSIVSVQYRFYNPNCTDKDKTVFFVVHLFKSDVLWNTDFKSVKATSRCQNRTKRLQDSNLRYLLLFYPIELFRFLGSGIRTHNP